MTNKYTAEDIKTLDGVESIRLRPGMFIGSIDSDGLHHLLLEVISNSIDEYLNGAGNLINIKIDFAKNEAIVEDNGRGIPFGKTKSGKEAITEICTNLHSGGKFGQGGYSVSGGLHGIGLTAVNSLSHAFSITSTRDKQQAHLKASRGVVQDLKIGAIATAKTGTIVSFIPDPEIFDKIVFDIQKIEKMVKQLSYLTSGLKFYVNGKLFYSENGLKDMIKDITPDPITDIIFLSGEIDKYKVEVAFQFEDRRGDRIYAFTNNIPNNEGGTHVTGFKTAFTNSMNRIAKDLGILKEGMDNLNGDLMRRGIVAAVSIKMAEAPVFQGQTKEKLMTAAARAVVSQVVNAEMEKAITKKDAKIIIDRALIEHKAERAAERSREAAKTVKSGGKSLNTLRDMPSKLVDCSDRINGELFICEGNSAAGSASMGRDTKTQAILGLRGKVLNTHDKDLERIVENKEIKDMLTAFGTGIGERFNIKNLRYKRIVILADADVDGAHINNLLLTLFLTHLPQLITDGKIHIAMPPLFKVTNGKTNTYFYSAEEMEQANLKGSITRFKGIGEMDSEELWETTMNPKTRKLMQLTTDNMQETLDLFQVLMGKSAGARKEFIMSNDLLELENEEFFGDDSDE